MHESVLEDVDLISVLAHQGNTTEKSSCLLKSSKRLYANDGIICRIYSLTGIINDQSLEQNFSFSVLITP